MKKPGERALLHYDPDLLEQQCVEVGDYIRTGTGRTYLVESVRVQQAGTHAGRHHLVTTVMEPDHQVEPDALVHRMQWYSRG